MLAKVVEERELSCIVGGVVNWKTAWGYLKKLKIELPYYPGIPLLGIYLKKSKTLIQKPTYVPMFNAVFF